MFQDISQSVVLIAFVWGPLVNGGIRMGTVVHVYGSEGDPCTHSSLSLALWPYKTTTGPTCTYAGTSQQRFASKL